MGDKYTDDKRLLHFTADNKTNLLMPVKFTATESMSSLFKIQIDLIADNDKADQVKGDQLLGKRMTLRLSQGMKYEEGPYRYFDGICSRFASVGNDGRFHNYEVELVPWIWLLTKRADLRVFQDKNVPGIVKTILEELQADFSDFQFEIRANQGNYKNVDYCVQFRETHFDFISRLMETDGLYYYFEHTDSGHKLIIDDSLTAGSDAPNQAEVTLVGDTGPGKFRYDNIDTWRENRVIHSGKFAARDYHSQLAQNTIEITGVTPKTNLAKNDKLEIFEWQSGSALRYNKTDQRLGEVNTVGNSLTNLRAQQSEVSHHTFTGDGCCRGFTPGYRFHFKKDPGKKYLLTEVQHEGVQNPDYISEDEVDDPYSNKFSSILSDLQYRPQRVTPKPTVEGLESAKVVGPKGEEIWIDKYGRVRVQFFWDRKGKNDETSTCWVRVAQISAGKQWGASFWPRIGQEVLVAFVEGDPDQPVIVGSVYNNQQMPPYLGDGPDDKHKNDPEVSGIKTNSTKGGDGFNELRFCDTKDKEQVFIHAEKDMDVRVKNERREAIYGDSHLIVGDPDNSGSGSLKQEIHNKWNIFTHKDKKETVKGDCFFTVGNTDGDASGEYHQYVKKDSLEYVGGDRHLKVAGSRSEDVGGQYSLSLGQLDAKVQQGVAIQAQTTMHLKAMTIVIEADLQLSLKVGGNFVDISVAGVVINGMPALMLNSGGAAGAGPGAQPASASKARQLANPPDGYFHKADDSKTGSKSSG